MVRSGHLRVVCPDRDARGWRSARARGSGRGRAAVRRQRRLPHDRDDPAVVDEPDRYALKPGSRGTWTLRVVKRADGDHLLAVSPSRTLYVG
jgi:hypothetical protein